MNKRHRLLNIGAYTFPEKYNSAKFKRSEDYLNIYFYHQLWREQQMNLFSVQAKKPSICT